MNDRNVLLSNWLQITSELAAIKKQESDLRKLVFGQFFENPKEGTNTFDLGKGYTLKGKKPYNYNVDDAALGPVSTSEQCKHIPWDKVIKNKPTLAKAEYNKLSDADKKLVMQALIITPGTESLEFIPPKEKKS